MPTLEMLLYVLPKRERQSAVPTGILVRLFPGSGHQWLSDQHATTARPSVLHPEPPFSSPDGVRQDIPTFFALASGSWTTASPRFRLRTAMPVWHQERSRCQLTPASCKTVQMV